jgi:hypothetical protein
MDDQPLTRGDLAQLERSLLTTSSDRHAVSLADILAAAKTVDNPAAYVVDVDERVLRKNGHAAKAGTNGA